MPQLLCLHDGGDIIAYLKDLWGLMEAMLYKALKMKPGHSMSLLYKSLLLLYALNILQQECIHGFLINKKGKKWEWDRNASK